MTEAINRKKGVAAPSEVIAVAIFFIFLYLAYMTADYLTTKAHELSHAVIFRYYGCQNITTTMHCTYFKCEGETTAVCPDEVANYVRLANSLLELRDYQENAMLGAILFMFFLIQLELILLISLLRR